MNIIDSTNTLIFTTSSHVKYQNIYTNYQLAMEQDLNTTELFQFFFRDSITLTTSFNFELLITIGERERLMLAHDKH